MNYILDTNICIHLLKNKSPNLIKKISQMKGSAFHLSSITEAELWFGICNSEKKSHNADVLGNFLSSFNRIVFNSEHARTFGNLKVEQRRKGKVVGEYDLLIASQAIEMDAVLVTANEKEFSQIKGLRIENWLR